MLRALLARDAQTVGFPPPLRGRVRERGTTRRTLSTLRSKRRGLRIATVVPSSIVSPGATPLPTLSRKERGSLASVLT